MLLFKDTDVPLEPAGPVRVIVPVELVPPFTDVGLSVKALSVAASTVRVAVFEVAPVWAVIVTDVLAETAIVLTAKVAVVEPAATVTVAGTVAAALPLVSVTVVPPGPAAPLRVTVPVEELPPVTVVGAKDKDRTVAGLTVKVAVRETVPRVAVTVALVWVDTAVVATENGAEVAPAGIVSEIGTVTEVLLLVKVTTDPPVGAGPFSVAVPVDDAPPMTVVGFRVSERSVGGTMVKVAVSVTVPSVAEIDDVDWAATAVVFTTNVAEVAPATTVTLAGTVAAALLLESDTTAPAEPAGPVRVIVPVDELPPVTDVGFSVSELRVAGLIVSVAV